MAKRVLFFLLSDLFLGVLTLYLSYALRFNFSIPSRYLDHFGHVALFLIVLKSIYFYIFKIYFKSWRYFGLRDFKQLFIAHFLAYSSFFLIFSLYPQWFNPMPRSAVIIDFFLSLAALGSIRISKRLLLESFGPHPYKNALILGLTPSTPQIIKAAWQGEIPYRPIAIFLPDSTNIQNGSYIENTPVIDKEKLEELIEKKAIKTVLITDHLQPKELNQWIDRLSRLGVEEFKKIAWLTDAKNRVVDIKIEDLMAREPKDLDIETIRRFIKDKTVLITGAGGSIGSEICRQCIDFGAKKLIAVEQSEYNLYALTESLPIDRCIPKLLSALDKEGLNKVFEAHKPDIVVHAAAYKHVPLCEANVDKAIENNILGSLNVIDLSIAHRACKVVNISTDKAVRPTNVMGTTKRIVELYAQNVPSGQTEIVSVRFGNVLGSSGSVVPKFKKQIEADGPVTVTHPEITRYFMLIPEACRLVLQAAAMAKGGELFILDMGEPVKIVDLAKKMIRLYGKEGEVAIEFTGLRPGEKLYEELLIDEAECQTKYESIYVAAKTAYPIEKLKQDIEALLKADDKIAALQRILPEFHPDTNCGS